ncbi:MAG: WbqC family protein [Planctomycetes bacterium]|nr:WbqC family protein [Planctomycetota bacterium]
MKVASIHQPNYLPWLGYFHKMTYCDVFVFLDDVQYTPRSYTNRCFLGSNGQKVRLSIPVHQESWDVPIRCVEIDARQFSRKHLEAFRHAYGKCSRYEEVIAVLEPFYRAGEISLAEFNAGLIRALAAFVGLRPRFVNLSELGLTSKKNDLLIDISRKVGADIFVSGVGARKYISGHEARYLANGVRLAYQSFQPPTYRQREPGFVAGLSAVDLVFNHGPTAREILTSQTEPPYLEWTAASAGASPVGISASDDSCEDETL